MTKPVVTFRLSDRTREQITALAERRGCSGAEIVTIAVDHMYQQENQEMLAMTKPTGGFDFHAPELLAALDAAGDNPEAIATTMAQIDEAIWANIRAIIPDKSLDYQKMQFRYAHNAVVAEASGRLFEAGHPSENWRMQLIARTAHIQVPK